MSSALAAKSAIGSIRPVAIRTADHSDWKLKRGAPARPFFVKIWITPLDASVPYSVAAAAPFRISTRSMDSGLMSSSFEGSPCPPPNMLTAALSTRTPST